MISRLNGSAHFPLGLGTCLATWCLQGNHWSRKPLAFPLSVPARSRFLVPSQSVYYQHKIARLSTEEDPLNRGHGFENNTYIFCVIAFVMKSDHKFPHIPMIFLIVVVFFPIYAPPLTPDQPPQRPLCYS